MKVCMFKCLERAALDSHMEFCESADEALKICGLQEQHEYRSVIFNAGNLDSDCMCGLMFDEAQCDMLYSVSIAPLGYPQAAPACITPSAPGVTLLYT